MTTIAGSETHMFRVGSVIKRPGSHTTHGHFTAPNTTALCQKVTAHPQGDGDSRSSDRRGRKGVNKETTTSVHCHKAPLSLPAINYG